MDDPTPKEEKNRRFDRLCAVQNQISQEIHQAYVGKTMRVLVDGRDGELLTARTEGGRLVRMSGQDSLIGQFVQAKITGYIDQNRQLGEANSFDTAMKILTTKLRWLLPPVIGLIRFLDNHGLLPQSLIDLTPFHASLLISNLASIRTNHIYHHVYEFGTTSVAITMGNMREVPRRSKDGIVFDRCMPLGVVMDERIASGHYMAQAFAQIKKYLADPHLMERESLDAEKAAEKAE